MQIRTMSIKKKDEIFIIEKIAKYFFYFFELFFQSLSYKSMNTFRHIQEPRHTHRITYER